MDKAKSAINDFMGKAGQKDTTVHETVAPAVTHETVKQHQHENVQTAVDKEVHQDHYHRTVQPVQDREVLPEQHSHNLGAVQHREFDHRKHDDTKRSLADEQAQFHNKQAIHDKTHSQSAAAVVGGEHVHHHLHETIQPVVHKETIQPSVVHTTVPIHETHHNAAQHHSVSELPPVNMSEFKERGGILSGREERYDAFEGEPKNIGGQLKGILHGEGKDGKHASGDLKRAAQHGDHNPTDGGISAAGSTGRGVLGSGAAVTGGSHHQHGDHHHDQTRNGGLTGGNNLGNNGNTNTYRGIETADGAGNVGKHSTSGVGGQRSMLDANDTNNTHHDTTTGAKKPGLMAKLNPKVDSDGDGKAGFMK
ncbi:hypothetical protein P154DRAFT_537640 [Amniculicola lignicola CBS 123094]|uniref:Allergen n=1 Tax=Amniculicola lignicola CBS 123094 TaxID=1392246 RepID=A0A6A5W4Q3_9PLEO|nr:hypothetical protein P154DRAFT_537640 [Amniculicola lignicola CBS 123094]